MTDFTDGYAAGDTAPDTVYLILGRYEEVEDLDGSFVEIEKALATPTLATVLAAGERGNVLVAAGSVISDDVATRIAAG